MDERGKCGGLFVNALLGVGLAFCGFFLGHSAERAVKTVMTKNYVSVKGLVDNRMIKSDHAKMYFWFEISGDDLEKLTDKAHELRQSFLMFCGTQQIQTAEITDGGFSLDDRHRDFVPTQYAQKAPGLRYVLRWSFTFNSSHVEKIQDFHKRLADYSLEFIKKGDIVTYVGRPSYYVYNLDVFRADMIADATKSARKAAVQFANDAGCKVGSIKRADQGTLCLEDVGDGLMKRARLVSYVDYYLI